MKTLYSIALSLLISTAAWAAQPFWLGADISGTTELEARGIQLYNAAGEPRENTQLMKDYGLNAVRYRVWVDPTATGGFCNPYDVLRMARRAKALGLAIMIDFHYSDWWADPGKQNIPAAWKDMNYEQMKNALAQHTEFTLRLLKDNGILVDWVQVGNETTNGFLWEMGRASEHMDQYAGLTEAGYQASKRVFPDTPVIVHLDGGCDPHRYNWIFDGLKQYGAHWDIIGMSIYPYWDIDAKLVTDYHGTIDGFVANIKRLYEKYGTELMIVETGVEARKPVEGKKILAEIIDAARTRCDGHCLGVFYWAPEADATEAYPLGAFDNHRPTAIMEAFSEAAAR